MKSSGGFSLTIGVLTAIAGGLALAFLPDARVAFVISIGISVGCALLSLLGPSLGVQTLLAAATILAVLAADVINNLDLAKSGLMYEAFVGNKIAAIAIAVIAPPVVWFDYTVIIFCMVLPLVEYFVIIPREFRSHVMFSEPWMAIMWGVVALGILRHRLAENKIERELAQVTAERDALQRRARIFLAIRDFANTPIQILALTAPQIRAKYKDDSALVDRLDYSLSKLRDLSELLSSYESSITWRHSDIAFDPLKLWKESEGK